MLTGLFGTRRSFVSASPVHALHVGTNVMSGLLHGSYMVILTAFGYGGFASFLTSSCLPFDSHSQMHPGIADKPAGSMQLFTRPDVVARDA